MTVEFYIAICNPFQAYVVVVGRGGDGRRRGDCCAWSNTSPSATLCR